LTWEGDERQTVEPKREKENKGLWRQGKGSVNHSMKGGSKSLWAKSNCNGKSRNEDGWEKKKASGRMTLWKKERAKDFKIIG